MADACKISDDPAWWRARSGCRNRDACRAEQRVRILAWHGAEDPRTEFKGWFCDCEGGDVSRETESAGAVTQGDGGY
jgi:poly(3-hydroxybutyrate) depolymerase